MPKQSKPVPKPGRLKVFMTQIGFHNWLVAAPNQKAALAAWDVKENLFAMGAAKVVTDQTCIDLAMKTPGEAVAIDAKHDLAKMTRVVHLADHRKTPAKAGAVAKKKSAPKRRKVDRGKLDRAEKALDDFHKRAVRERAAILRARKALDLKAEALGEELDAEQEKLEEAVDDARDRYEAEEG
jgi:colicin import membrane protein